MAYFEWADDMVIDHGPIDADHMRLVELVNELHTATSQGQGQAVVNKILHDLMDYTTGHFRREEHLMASIRYPGLPQHKALHDKFILRLEALLAKCEAGSVTVASQLSTTLRDWLSLHIRREDKALLAHVSTTRKLVGGEQDPAQVCHDRL